MKREDRTWAVNGILGVAAAAFSIMAAVLLYPGYNPAIQYLSELGIGGNSAVFFNLGLVISGLIFIRFFLEFPRIFRKSLTVRIGSSLGSASCLALICVGLFPMTQPVAHFASSASFFILSLLAVLFLSIRMFSERLVFNGMLGIIFIISGALFLTSYRNSVMEIVTVFLLILWILAVSVHVLRKK